jgi:hypothetical protein
VTTEYALHAARHPEAAALLHRHREELHTQLTDLIERAAADAGLRLTLPAGQLARTVTALHDGASLLSLTQPAVAAELERPALLLLLTAAVGGPPNGRT